MDRRTPFISNIGMLSPRHSLWSRDPPPIHPIIRSLSTQFSGGGGYRFQILITPNGKLVDHRYILFLTLVPIMAPIAITPSLTSPPGLPVKKSALASQTKDQGVGLDQDGSSTPYSATSTAVSENGELLTKGGSPPALSSPKVTLDNVLPKVEPGSPDYYTHLLSSSSPSPSTRSGSTVYGSAIDVLEALAVKHSESVWVYDDAVQVGFGSRLSSWNLPSVHSVQTRQGAGMELAGYARKSSGRLSVFATTSTLPYLLPNLKSIEGNVVIHVGTTEPKSTWLLTTRLVET